MCQPRATQRTVRSKQAIDYKAPPDTSILLIEHDPDVLDTDSLSG
jgi:hypothetical protein